MNNISDEEREKINKYLMRALDNICRIEKLLKDIKGSDSNGKRTKSKGNKG